MTKTKAIAILQQHGFEITTTQTPRSYLAEIRHPATGTHILGRIYEDSMYIKCTLNPNRAPQWFNFGQGSSSRAFDSAVEKLAEELKHYEETLRHERVENVRKYFKDRGAYEFAKSLHDADRRSV